LIFETIKLKVKICRFTAVPPGQESGDEERGGGDMSTGVTLTSR